MPTAESKDPAEIAAGLNGSQEHVLLRCEQCNWINQHTGMPPELGEWRPVTVWRFWPTPLGRAVAAHLEQKP